MKLCSQNNNHFCKAFAIATLILFVFLSTPSIFALSSIDLSLSSIENKLFEHDYPKDDDKARLSRIENFVFGTTSSGSDQERLNSLLKVIPETNNSQTKDQNTSSTTEEHKSSLPNTANASSANNSQASKNTFEYSHYPRVTNLEQSLLGHTYADQGLTERLNRLETKCFGKPATNPDLNQRVENVELYAQRHDLYGDSNRTANAFNNNSAQSPLTTPRQQNIENMIIVMENKEFGHPFPNRSLQKRLSKLENKIYHHDNEKDDLSVVTRTNNLWSTLMANNSTSDSTTRYNKHKNSNSIEQPIDNNMTDQYGISTAGSQYADSQTSPSKPHHSLLHKVAQVAGTVGGATAKALAATSGMGGYGMGSYGMSGYGMNSSGMGYPMGGYGMSGYSTGYGMNTYRSPYW